MECRRNRRTRSIVAMPDGIKRVRAAATQLLSGYGTKGLDNYAGMVACEVLAAHRDGYRTLVIVNRVARAQAIYEALRRAGRRDRMILNSFAL